MQDTSDDVRKLYHKLLSEKTGEERFLMGISMCETARKMVLASFRDDLTEIEKRKKIFFRYYGNDFSVKAKKEIIDAIDKSTCKSVS